MPGFFIILFLVYLVANGYIFYRGWQTLARCGKGIKIVYPILFLFFAGGIILQFTSRDVAYPPLIGHWLYYCGTGWLIFTLYMTLWLILMEIVGLGGWLIKARWRTEPTRYKQFRQKSYWEGFLLVICILSIGHYRYQHPKTEVINIVINKPVNGVEKNLKVVAVSDIHLGYGTDKNQLKKYVDLINAQRPDLILIGGDLIDNSLLPVRMQRMEEELSQLKAPMGIYAIPGNHEYISNMEASAAFMRNTPIKLLRDSVVTLPDGIQLVGRDDRHNHRRAPLSVLLQSVDKSKPIILLDHQPYKLNEAISEGVDLQFSGHTHRGQIWPMSLLVDRMFELSHGLMVKEGTHIYVSSGLSLWGPPFRIGTQSELVVFNICFK